MEKLLGLFSNIQAHLVSWNLVSWDGHRWGVSSELISSHNVDWENELDAVLLCGLHVALDGVNHVFLNQGLADFVALSLEEGEEHAAADDEAISFVEQVLDDAELVGNLGATENDGEWTLWAFGSARECLDFLLDEQASCTWQNGCDIVVGALCAVNHAEAIGDEDVSELGELFSILVANSLILGGLFWVEAHVLEQNDVAILHSCNLSLSILTIGVMCENDVHTHELTEAGSNRSERELRNNLALWTAEMSHHDDLGTLIVQFGQSWECSTNTTIISNLRAIERDIKIGAHQNALAGKITEILQSLHISSFHPKNRRVAHVQPLLILTFTPASTAKSTAKKVERGKRGNESRKPQP